MNHPKCKLFVSEEMIINILNRLPLKSLAKFKCISKNWRKYIAEIYRSRVQWPEPYQIGFFCVEKRSESRFFFSSKESSLLIGTSLDKTIKSIGERVYIVSSSNGYLLCNKLRSRQRVYYVYNPATRQRLDVPKTRILMIDPYVGFTCKVDEDDSVSFTIVRYVTPRSYLPAFQYSLTIESFSSETNVWTATKLIEDVPFPLYPSRDKISSSSAGVVDGVFFWLDNNGRQMTVFDSVKKCFWALELPVWRNVICASTCCLGLSGGELSYALNHSTTIVCRDNAVWVRKYVIDIAIVFQKCSEDFGLGGRSALCREVRNMVFHPALPHILYLQIRDKVISYDVRMRTVELVYDFGEAWQKNEHYKLFSYEWPQWPRLSTGGELYFASDYRTTTIICWRLNNFPSRDAVWVWKYDVDVVTIIKKCQADFGLEGGNALDIKVQNMVFHPAFPDILYLQIRGKVISYDVKTRTAQLVYDFGEAWRKTKHYKLFSYEWPKWPRFL